VDADLVTQMYSPLLQDCAYRFLSLREDVSPEIVDMGFLDTIINVSISHTRKPAGAISRGAKAVLF
jgi:hypothetical protein